MRRRWKPRQIPHPAEKLVQIERLGHVLVGAQVEAAGAVLGQGAGAEDQHGNIAVGRAHRLAHGVAAHPRQHEVQHDQIDAAGRLLEDFQRRGAVAHGGHAVSLRDQVVLDAGGQVVFVFDDQDVFVRRAWLHSCGTSGSSPAALAGFSLSAASSSSAAGKRP